MSSLKHKPDDGSERVPLSSWRALAALPLIRPGDRAHRAGHLKALRIAAAMACGHRRPGHRDERAVRTRSRHRNWQPNRTKMH